MRRQSRAKQLSSINSALVSGTGEPTTKFARRRKFWRKLKARDGKLRNFNLFLPNLCAPACGLWIPSFDEIKFERVFPTSLIKREQFVVSRLFYSFLRRQLVKVKVESKVGEIVLFFNVEYWEGIKSFALPTKRSIDRSIITSKSYVKQSEFWAKSVDFRSDYKVGFTAKTLPRAS